MKDGLFLKNDRKKIVFVLMRKIIKFSNSNIRPFDEAIGDFIYLEIRRKFDEHKHINNLAVIDNKLFNAERIYEDLLRIKKENGNDKNSEYMSYPKLDECNYLVLILLLLFL